MAIWVDEKFRPCNGEQAERTFCLCLQWSHEQISHQVRPRKQTTRWAVIAFQDWRDTHNAQPVNVKCTNNLLVECEAGALNRWLAGFVAEALWMWRWLTLFPKDHSNALGRVAPTQLINSSGRTSNFLQKRYWCNSSTFSGRVEQFTAELDNWLSSLLTDH